ncbi:MAG: Uma2 family endonuclease [Verrucomicrobia bacterium]|nr:Uma2 family endonuclease [Cytophagales bacterium]
METLTKISVEAYLENEAKAAFKSQYVEGEVVAMAGAGIPHKRIVANLIAELVFCLKNKNCQVFPSDLLLEIAECDRYTYPDIVVVRGKVETDSQKRGGLDVLLNPSIVIEVLSDTTEKDDRGDKFECYKTLPSLKTYVLVSSKKVLVEIFERTPENNWLIIAEKDISKTIQMGDCEVLLEEIYDKVIF